MRVDKFIGRCCNTEKKNAGVRLLLLCTVPLVSETARSTDGSVMDEYPCV